VKPARWFPIADPAEGRVAELDPDGGLRVVERGLRLVEHPDGRIERAADLLPSEAPVAALRLPSRLGRGFLFHTASAGTTRIWRAATWTAPLAPLVRLPFEAGEIDAGFDRLYAVGTRTRAVVGFDGATGAILGGGGLPASPTYGGMAFSDPWLGAVEVDVRGALVTFDAGASFHPVRVPMTVPGVSEQGGRIILATTRGAYALEPSGDLARADGPAADTGLWDLAGPRAADQSDTEGQPTDDAASALHSGILGPRPLEVAVLRGLPDSAGTAVVAANGAIARVALEDGRLLATLEHALPPGATCHAIRLGLGLGLVCGQDRGATTVYALRAPLGVDVVLDFPEPRVVLPSDNGALVIRGGCPGSPPSSDAVYCVVPVAGARREIRVRGDVGVERVAALADGRVVVLVPPRLGIQGSLTVVGDDGRAVSRPLVLDSVPGEVRDLLTHGMWLDGLVEIEPAELAGWVAGSQPFVGVRVSLDGKVMAGTARSGIDRASVAGAFGLVTDAHGGGHETTDGGMTWSELKLPVAVDAVTDAAPDRERGCTRVGCSIGSWVRVGWGKSGPGDLVAVADPPPARIAAAPFVTWAFDCAPTRSTEAPREATSVARPPRRDPVQPAVALGVHPRFAVLESSAFRPFLGVAAPERSPSELGFDLGTEDRTVQVRGYAWGARDAAWDRDGTWLVRVADRFSSGARVWSTAPSRAPWADAAAAAEQFGSEPSHRVASEWDALLDPVEGAGVLLMRAGSAVELAVIEKQRAIVVVRNSDDFPLDRVAGVAKVGGHVYLGSVPGARTFQILRIDGGRLSSLATYPRYTDDSDARVVRSQRGDALGIWVIARGQLGTRSGGDTWFVFPVDLKSGAAGAPLVVSRDALSHAPRPCEPEEDGWVLPHDVSPSVTKIDFTNLAEAPAVARLEARLVAGPGGLCLDALAAQVGGEPPRDLAPRGEPGRTRRGTPLTLTDRATDRRWEFHCSP
jgi:hypothetical protein